MKIQVIRLIICADIYDSELSPLRTGIQVHSFSNRIRVFLIQIPSCLFERDSQKSPFQTGLRVLSFSNRDLSTLHFKPDSNLSPFRIRFRVVSFSNWTPGCLLFESYSELSPFSTGLRMVSFSNRTPGNLVLYRDFCNYRLSYSVFDSSFIFRYFINFMIRKRACKKSFVIKFVDPMC